MCTKNLLLLLLNLWLVLTYLLLMMGSGIIFFWYFNGRRGEHLLNASNKSRIVGPNLESTEKGLTNFDVAISIINLWSMYLPAPVHHHDNIYVVSASDNIVQQYIDYEFFEDTHYTVQYNWWIIQRSLILGAFWSSGCGGAGGSASQGCANRNKIRLIYDMVSVILVKWWCDSLLA